MTLIRDKYTRQIYERFGVMSNGVNGQPHTMFLIYADCGWTWRNSKDFEPVYDPPNCTHGGGP